jgi:histidine triad (HIT) family protein
MAFVCPRWWPNNHGHVLVVPIRHYENLYELAPEAGHAVHDLVRDVAIAIRSTYGCEGISTRQHNEPAGNQDAWHYHVHVFPRYAGDELYASKPYPEFVTAEQRQPYAERLRRYFATKELGAAELDWTRRVGSVSRKPTARAFAGLAAAIPVIAPCLCDRYTSRHAFDLPPERAPTDVPAAPDAAIPTTASAAATVTAPAAPNKCARTAMFPHPLRALKRPLALARSS